MKNLLLILVMILFFSACSFHSRQTKLESNKNETENQKSEVVENKISAESLKVEEVKPILVKNEIPEVEKVLNKKINPNTFDDDMKIIEESELYDMLTCQSLRYSYGLVRQYSPNSWDITYRKALESSKEGSENAKRISRIGTTTNN